MSPVTNWRSSRLLLAGCAFVGIFNDIVSYSLPIPFLPQRLEEIGIEKDQIGTISGYLVAGFAVGAIISSPLAAWLGSRFRNHRLALRVTFVLCLAAGIPSTGSWTFLLAMVSDSVDSEKVPAVLGFVMIGLSAGNVVGPLVGGVLYQHLGYRSPFYFIFALVALDLLLRVLVVDEIITVSQHSTLKDTEIELLESSHLEYKLALSSTNSSASPDFFESSVEIHASLEKEQENPYMSKRLPTVPVLPITLSFTQQLRALLSGRFSTLLMLSILNGVYVGCFLDTALAIYLSSTYGLNAEQIGLVFIAAVIPSFFVSPLIGWWTASRSAKLPVFLILFVSIPLFLLCLLHVPLSAFILFIFALGPTLVGFSSVLLIDLSIAAEESIGVDSSTVFAAFQLFYFVGTLIGSIGGGHLISLLGIEKGWLVVNVISASLTALCLFPVYIFVGGRKQQVEKTIFRISGA